MTPDTRSNWDDVSRVEAWAGEIRVNLVRLVAIVLFYGRHLVEFFMSRPPSNEMMAYHTRVTWVVAVWAAAVVMLHVNLVRRRVVAELKYASAVWDAAMITLLCCIAGGPRSPLVLLFFPLIATAPLRMSLRLVWVTTAAGMLGYLCVLGYYAWYRIGFTKYYATPELRIPRSEEAVYLLAMLVSGLLAGQMVRQARRMVTGYPVAVAMDDAPGGAAGGAAGDATGAAPSIAPGAATTGEA